MKRPCRSILAIMLCCWMPLQQTFAASAGRLPVPRFASLRSAQINLRRGPGTQYPIDWVFVRAGLPVEIISEFETWRKIRDVEGAEGWVHQSMLSGKRSVMTPPSQNVINLLKNPDQNSPSIAKVGASVVGQLLSCKGSWCRVNFQNHKGWLRRIHFWGVYQDETIK